MTSAFQTDIFLCVSFLLLVLSFQYIILFIIFLSVQSFFIPPCPTTLITLSSIHISFRLVSKLSFLICLSRFIPLTFSSHFSFLVLSLLVLPLSFLVPSQLLPPVSFLILSLLVALPISFRALPFSRPAICQRQEV